MIQKTFEHKQFIWTILFPYKLIRHGDLSKFELFKFGSFIITFFPKNDKLILSKEWDSIVGNIKSIAAMKKILIQKGTVK